MKLAFIGIGNVGFALANNLEKKGHEILLGNNNTNSETVLKAISKNNNFKVVTIQKAIDSSDVVFLATPFAVNEKILKALRFNDKILIDCTNPVGAGISHGLQSKISGAEKVQEWAPDARVVKAYTIYGFENLIDSNFPNYHLKPVMMIAGNDAKSKNTVGKLNSDLGFETLDVGGLDLALHLEHMTLLWVKMARRDGHHPNFTWAYIEK
ncbi:NADPH-dependent F420 reductase [Spongiimicrobium sp. 3-5]|uniref:NADPH-dependent F420 reductase n=1 Tax=Spongiimicrobium sp. 3-5 TaxID=3332596 RepID=UPI00397F071C